ncbi:MAG: YbaY family lipoprotein [Microcoleaceae cyanobacterium]
MLILLAVLSLLPLQLSASAQTMPSRKQVCAIVKMMPGTSDTDELVSLLGTTRTGIIDSLNELKILMERLDTEGYGWQNVLGSSSPEVQIQPSIIGALSMACEDVVAAQPNATVGVVSGMVTYRQRVALPPGAVVKVKLVDASIADARAVTIAEQTIQIEDQQVPIPFELTYDPEEIDPSHRYAVQAQITFEGQLRWVSTTSYPVITQDSPSTVEVVVEPVEL